MKLHYFIPLFVLNTFFSIKSVENPLEELETSVQETAEEEIITKHHYTQKELEILHKNNIILKSYQFYYQKNNLKDNPGHKLLLKNAKKHCHLKKQVHYYQVTGLSKKAIKKYVATKPSVFDLSVCSVTIQIMHNYLEEMLKQDSKEHQTQNNE